ncbi:dihydropteroate synthase [Cyanobium sp. HWJ4-Hawea]|uniref:dihydropteroate synthase n=1 Tax=Cyanobium sp. HWJ4-Hawea TaxID=2823713 RepID=UPI0020CE803C|nr:dihydropteroate synthase [Cyanobium sp. HWJ4-Hawea]
MFPWGERTAVMGVLNLTPDSFSDGGRFESPVAALKQAGRLLGQGADLLDLGAQSTRPGAVELDAEQEWQRLAGPLGAIRGAHPQALLSVDTFSAAVAEKALAGGANWINDVRGASGRRDPAMLAVVAEAGCAYVLMHSRGTASSMDQLGVYGDVVVEVRDALRAATDEALAAGIAEAALIWDPGLGFAKGTDANLELLRRLELLVAEGFPLLVGPSRKRFIGDVLNQARPQARLWGTAAVCSQVIGKGARILRVHDVGPIVQIARMADALKGPSSAGPIP